MKLKYNFLILSICTLLSVSSIYSNKTSPNNFKFFGKFDIETQVTAGVTLYDHLSLAYTIGLGAEKVSVASSSQNNETSQSDNSNEKVIQNRAFNQLSLLFKAPINVDYSVGTGLILSKIANENIQPSLVIKITGQIQEHEISYNIVKNESSFQTKIKFPIYKHWIPYFTIANSSITGSSSYRVGIELN
jgi:hypothetical protein